MNDILSFHILQRVNPSDLLNCALVSKEWNSIISSFDFIRRYCKKQYVNSHSKENKRTDLVILKFLYELTKLDHMKFKEYYNINSIYYSSKLYFKSFPIDKLKYLKYLKFNEAIHVSQFFIKNDTDLCGYKILLYCKDKNDMTSCRQFDDSSKFIEFMYKNINVIRISSTTYDQEQKLIILNHIDDKYNKYEKNKQN